MNGLHDMGGMQCYGPVVPEIDEPIFHKEWEKRAMAMTVAMGFTGMWNIDISRFARESLPPNQYLQSSYYQIWLAGLEKMMLERGMVTHSELASGASEVPPVATRKSVPDAGQIGAALAKGGPTLRECANAPKFSIGDQVKTIVMNPTFHTRLPSYGRGKMGIVIHVNGAHVFPDSNARGDGENPQWLYTVEFTSNELFGSGNHFVTLDLWEPYLRNG